MALIMYDLAGAQANRRFSPFCWRIRLAIAHKGLEVETVPWRFTEKAAIAFSGQDRVPVLVDDGKTVAGSWKIASHLEEKYPQRPSLFGGAVGIALARFVEGWNDNVVQGGMVRLILIDVFAHIHEKDRAYFRESREKRLGMTIEQACAGREERVAGFRSSLEPLRTTLRLQPFVAGESPNYADYIVFGSFMWARSTSPFSLLTPDDPIYDWRKRMLDRFEFALQALGYDA